MKDLFQTSIDQTAVAICTFEDGSTKHYPLFSMNPLEEYRELRKSLPSVEKYQIYITNNMMVQQGSNGIEGIVSAFVDKTYIIPENYMDEMVSGFPFVASQPYSLVHFYE